MAEIIAQYEHPIASDDGTVYHARACGRQEDDGSWEGWIEFEPTEAAAAVLRTSRETDQPNRTDLEYWASGLTPVYLEGALESARRPLRVRQRVVEGAPAFDAPAPRTIAERETVPSRSRPRGVLDPFRVYRQGEYVLARELGALDADRLRDIISQHGMAPDVDLGALSHAELERLILDAARGGGPG